MQRGFRGAAGEIQGKVQFEFSAACGYELRYDRSLRRAAHEKFSRKILSRNRAHVLLDWAGRENTARVGESEREGPRGRSASGNRETVSSWLRVGATGNRHQNINGAQFSCRALVHAQACL